MLRVVAEILERRGSEGWLVGGSVRDRILARYSPDSDVAVADDAAAVAKEVAAALQAPWFSLSERHPTYRVLGADGYVDVAAVRGDILCDLGQRDFTVNAMAVSIASAAYADARDDDGLLDPFGGAAHLAEGRLVAVSEGIFAADPLRLMRAPRFCHTLGLRVDSALAEVIREQAPELSKAAAERVVSEMCLTLAAGHAAAAVRMWDELDLLPVILPELGAGGTPDAGAAGGRPDRSLTLSRLERLDALMERPTERFPGRADAVAARLAEPLDGAITRPVALRLAGLTLGLSAPEARAMARRLKLSGAMESLLSAMARASAVLAGAHTEAGEAAGPLAGLLPAGAPVDRAAVLFLWEAAPWEPEAIMMAAAEGDALGFATEPASRLLSLHFRRANGEMSQLPLDGDTLMRALDLQAGPLLGQALREARLAWESGEARTAEEALAVAKKAVAAG
jgi:tRNA nucleotidyltransferase/poly(A) polymerase